jgi:hypothetical protein
MKTMLIGLVLVSGFIFGCTSTKVATSPTHSMSASSEPQALSADTKTKLEQIQKDYGVVVMVHGHVITVGTAGLITNERMSQIKDALHKAFGDDFASYTINNLVD